MLLATDGVLKGNPRLNMQFWLIAASTVKMTLHNI